MPDQLTEQQFNAVLQRVMASAPDGLDEAGFNALLDAEVAKAEQGQSPTSQQKAMLTRNGVDPRIANTLVDGMMGGGVMSAAPSAGGQGVKLVQGLARRLYSGLLKPSKAVRQEFGDVVPGLLANRRLITRGSAEAAEGAVDAARSAADDLIAQAAPTATDIPAREVISEFAPVVKAVRDRVRAGVVPPGELSKIGERGRRMVRTAGPRGHGVSVTEAQTLKRTSQDAAQGAYKQMRAGQTKMLSTDDLLDAATARGFKGGLEKRVPGLQEANQQTQTLIGQLRALQEAVGRTGNHLPFGSVSDLAAMTAGASNPVIGVMAKASTMAGPGSAMAIGLNELGRLPLEQMTRAAIIQMMRSHDPQ